MDDLLLRAATLMTAMRGFVVLTACMLTLFLGAAVIPSGAGGVSDATSYCSDSTTLGEPDLARCFLDHPTCTSGDCVWPDVHVRVWVEEGFEGSLTPRVTGAVFVDDEVCRGDKSCQGVYPGPFVYGTSIECDGYGPSGGLILAITESINIASAVHMECWTE